MEEKKTVIIRILGGLGNQMFEYAMGRNLSIIHKRVLKLDLNFYKEQNSKWAIRSYDLSHFKIQAEIATEPEIEPFKKYLKQNLSSKILRRTSSYIPGMAKSYIFEPPEKNFTFNNNLLRMKLPAVAYFDGFWQTEKYFLNIEDAIRKDFIFADEPDEVNRQMLQQIDGLDSVAIHIRHGDNATKVAAHHGVLPIRYYHRAIGEITNTVKNPHFYIFSDDPQWAKENLKISNQPAILVAHNGEEKHHEDMRLMSRCKHHIIGNSTFSWWGAWLGKKTGQLVYAPKRYHMKANIEPVDFYPITWNLIDV